MHNSCPLAINVHNFGIYISLQLDLKVTFEGYSEAIVQETALRTGLDCWVHRFLLLELEIRTQGYAGLAVISYG